MKTLVTKMRTIAYFATSIAGLFALLVLSRIIPFFGADLAILLSFVFGSWTMGWYQFYEDKS